MKILLRALGLGLRLEPLGMPTLHDVRARFADDGDDDEEGTSRRSHEGHGSSPGAPDD